MPQRRGSSHVVLMLLPKMKLKPRNSDANPAHVFSTCTASTHPLMHARQAG